MPDQNNTEKPYKKSDPIADMRAQLCSLLPRAMQNAIESYQQFAQQIAPDDAKHFIVHHNACRAALAHLDALSKLGRWLVAQHPQLETTDELQPLLLRARQVLTQLDGSLNETDSDDESSASKF